MFELLQAELTKLNIKVEFHDDTWPALVKKATDWGTTRDPTRTPTTTSSSTRP